MPASMVARKAGTCRICGGGIKPGENILWYKGWGAKHAGCRGEEAQDLPPSAGGNGNGKAQGKAQGAPCNLPREERVTALERAEYVAGQVRLAEAAVGQGADPEAAIAKAAVAAEELCRFLSSFAEEVLAETKAQKTERTLRENAGEDLIDELTWTPEREERSPF